MIGRYSFYCKVELLEHFVSDSCKVFRCVALKRERVNNLSGSPGRSPGCLNNLNTSLWWLKPHLATAEVLPSVCLNCDVWVQAVPVKSSKQV